jgi:hypothetical protein
VEFVVAHEIYAGYFLDDSIVCRMIVSNLTPLPRKESLFPKCLNPLSRKISYCVLGGKGDWLRDSSLGNSSSSSLEDVDGLWSRELPDAMDLLPDIRAFLRTWLRT